MSAPPAFDEFPAVRGFIKQFDGFVVFAIMALPP